MSVEAYRWAWDQQAKPVTKLVLLALAEHANGQGVCWPSLSRLQTITGLARSSVAVALAALEGGGMISRERSPGGVTRYHLRTSPGDGLANVSASPGGVPTSPGDGLALVREPDGGSPGAGPEPQRTVNKNHHKPPTGPVTETEGFSPSPPEPPSTPSLVGGGGEDLIFPAGMNRAEQEQAATIVAGCNGHAQDVLDELAGLMTAGAIRVSSLACLRGLVKREQAGTFSLEAGQGVKQARKTAAKREAREKRDANEWPANLPKPSADEVQALRNRSRRRLEARGNGNG